MKFGQNIKQQRYEMALSEYYAGRMRQSAVYYRESITMAENESIRDSQFLFEKQVELAEIFFAQEDHQPALDIAYGAYRELGRSRRILLSCELTAEYLIRLGNILFALEEYSGAVDCLAAVAEAHTGPGLRMLAMAKKALAMAKTGDYTPATSLLLNILDTPGLEDEVKNKTQKYLADVYSYSGEYGMAIRYYNEAWQALKEMTGFPPDWPLEILNNLASANYETGNYSSALEQYKMVVSALDKISQPGAGSFRLEALLSISHLCLVLYDIPYAIKILDSVDLKTLTEKEQVKLKMVRARLELTESPDDQRDRNGHLDDLMRHPFGNLDLEHERDLLNLQSYIALREGNTFQATESQKRLASYYRRKGNIHQQISHNLNLCLYLQYTGETYLNGEITTLLSETEELLDQSECSMFVLTMYIKVAGAYCEQQDYGSSKRILLRVFGHEQELFRNIVFSGDHAGLYHTDLLDLLTSVIITVSRNLVTERVSLEEQFVKFYIKSKNLAFSKNSVFKELAGQNTPGGRDTLTRYRQKVKELMVHLPGEPGGYYEKLKAEVESLEYKIKGTSDYFDRVNRLIDHDWLSIRGKLEDDEAAVTFFRYESIGGAGKDKSNYSVFIIRKDQDHPVFCHLDMGDDQLRAMLPFFIVRDYREGLSFRTTVENPMISILGRLYELLFKPIEPFLSGIGKVFFTQDGLLHLIPFHALVAEKNRFLSDQYELVLLQSLHDLKEAPAGKPIDEMALFGGIDFGHSVKSLDPEEDPENPTLSAITNIAAAGAEITEISDVFRSKGVEPEIRNQLDLCSLNEMCVRKAPAAIHFLTHGYFFNDPQRRYNLAEIGNFSVRDINSHANPLLRSGLIASDYNFFLSKEKVKPGERGAITSFDISRLPMDNTLLVTLHACETALGAVRNGDSYGLARAFKMAGVKYVILTLWKIRHTEFYLVFYRHLVGSATFDVRQAFNSALTEMRELYPNPYYWGGFVLIE